MFTLNFTRKVLGVEGSLKLERHKVIQTIRAGTSDVVKAVMNSELRAGDELRIALDGENIGIASLIACEWVPAVGLTCADAQKGGFSNVDELGAALKRAGYRFKPLIDYVFYRVQFGWGQLYDEESRKHIAELEKNSRFPTGIGRVECGECPCGVASPVACTFCPYGHMLECHYPYTCEDAECSHYQRDMEVDNYGWGEDKEPV